MTQDTVSPPTAGALPEQRACLFDLAGFHFAVDVRSAREVVLLDEITAVPLAPRHLVGVANLRGTVMPIVDIRTLLDLPVQRPASSVRTLVLRAGPLQAAVVVDAVLGLEPFGEILPREFGDTGPAALGRFAAGRAKWGAESVLLLDVPKILEVLRPHRLRLGSGTAEE